MSSQKIYTDLNIPQDKLYSLSTIQNANNIPQRSIKSLNEIKPDNILIINNKPIILFFHTSNEILKKGGKAKIFRNCWNFSEAPIIIIEDENNFEVYNGFEIISKTKELPVLPKEDLSYLSLLNGEYFKKLKTSTKTKRIDEVLLKNIKLARQKLIDKELSKDIANSLIGRIIFIRYLIDRRVSLGKYKKALSNEDLIKILTNRDTTYELFNYLKSDKGFNGDWFPIDKNESIVNETHLDILIDLISGNDLENNQRSLFDFSDFSIIPIEFISNVYENFIGESEQKEEGAYYTPTFLVDYVLQSTIDKYFKNNSNEYNCKVLDPACGSGIFLVETLRKLVGQFEKIKNKKINQDELKKLVKDNIFGIDKNENAVSISVFSLYLTMLDYQNPKELENFKFPYLLDSARNSDLPNFFKNDFFNTEAKYNDILKNKKIDFIIGNPPYGGSSIEEISLANKYAKSNQLNISNKEIVQAFMFRVQDLVSKNTKISFIITSKILYNFKANDFRKQFLNTFKISHILELSSVRKEIFKSAKVPVSILFYEKSTKEEIQHNEINYISMKPSPFFENLKILLISKNDCKKVAQKKLLEYDYLWKILVYGSYLDFNFLKRLKESYTLMSKKIITKEGIIIGKIGKNPTDAYNNMPFIETKQMVPFYIHPNNKKWESKLVCRASNINVFTAPFLAVSKGVSQSLEIKSAILTYDAVFTNSISSVRSTSLKSLYNIMGLLHSSIFKFYTIQTASSVGIEREQSLNIEKFNMPYTENDTIIEVSKNIEKLLKNNLIYTDEKLKSLKTKLNDAVYVAFNISKQEKSLIDYANNIMIPWIIQKKYDIAFKPYDFSKKKDKEKLENYANITIKENEKMYNKMGKFFQATILYNKYVIGVYYKVLDKKQDKQTIWKEEPDIENFLKISSKETIENLFIQKDIKGFESNGYYVIKPNEYKNWHEAIGYLDFYEFEKAILNAGRNGSNEYR